MNTKALLTLGLCAIQHAAALNILAIVSLPLGSHYMAFKTLFHELANRGHFVTVINNFPDKKPPKNLSYIDLKAQSLSSYSPPMEQYEHRDASTLHLYNIYRHTFLSSILEVDCENLLTNVDVKEHLSRGVQYDVIFVEQFMSDCGLVYAAALYDAPIIGITSHVMLPYQYQRLGVPFDISSDAHYFSNAGPNPSLVKKVETAFFNIYLNYIARWQRQRFIAHIFDKHLPDKNIDVEQMAKDRMKMMFLNQHFSITGARALVPQVLEIAGIHIQKPKPVPESIENFISKADHGVIYVSFGSILKASSMSEQKLEHFLTAFKQIPQKVLWKWENASLPEGNDNIMTASWMPQVDVLCHPRVLAFVSHGGMLSMSEAAYCGKPLLTIPFFGDQFANAASAVSSGLGISIYFQNLKTDNLVQALKELTSDKMKRNAERVSKLWHDRPIPVLDSAVYWTEYVARHRTAPPSLPAINSCWYESYLIDVYSIVIAILLAPLVLLYFILKLIKKMILSCTRANVLKKKKKN